MEPHASPLRPSIVLGIAAHPDDLDVGAGGALAGFAAQGAEIHYLVLTDGSKGSDDPSITSPQLVALRQDEQRAALDAIGGKTITFLDHIDGELEITMALKKQIVQVIRAIKPDLVITMDPTVVYSQARGIINHPDHRAAGQATLDAVFPLARDRLAFPDLAAAGFEPHNVSELLLINFDKGTYGVDITDTFQTKLRAVQAHTSQFKDSEGMDWLKQMAQEEGKKFGYELAESFVRIAVR